MKKALIAGAGVAALGMAVLPMAGVFAASTDDTVITDTLSVTVEATCTFSTKTAYNTSTQTATSDGNVSDTAYAATVLNGAIASFNNSSSHKFGVVCNNSKGWTVTATDPADLAANGVTGHSIAYSAAALPAANSEKEGVWNAIVTGDTAAAASTTEAPTGIVVTNDVKYIKDGGGVIATEGKST